MERSDQISLARSRPDKSSVFVLFDAPERCPRGQILLVPCSESLFEVRVCEGRDAGSWVFDKGRNLVGFVSAELLDRFVHKVWLFGVCAPGVR